METGADLTTTDSAVVADKATPDTPAATVTDTATDTAGKDVQARINSLSAQLAREKTATAKLQTQMEQLAEKHKTEDEKRIDALVQTKIQTQYGDKLQRVDALESALAEMATAEIAKLPEGAEGLVDLTAPPEVQLRQAITAQTVLASNMTTEPTTGTGPAANPAGPGKQRTISMVEFRSMQRQANDDDPVKRAEFKAKWPEYKAAYQAGLVVG